MEEMPFKEIKISLQYIDLLELKLKEVTTQRNELATTLSEKEDEKQKLIKILREQANRKIPLAEDKDYIQGYSDFAGDLLVILKGERK